MLWSSEIVTKIFGKYTMEVNYDSSKSAAISWNEDITAYRNENTPYTMLRKNEEFELLGASLSCDTRSFFEKKKKKQQDFFNLIGNLHLHPALLYSMQKQATC